MLLNIKLGVKGILPFIVLPVKLHKFHKKVIMMLESCTDVPNILIIFNKHLKNY